MPLTAKDPNTGQIIWPGSGGRTAVCRDPSCAAEMHAVRASEEGDLLIRRAYWRHSVHASRENCPTRNDSGMTPWHADWQMRTDDPNRVEVVVKRGDNVRRADIVTKWGYAIEVQHSAISESNVKGRENHYSGKVIWLYDGTGGGSTGGVDQYKGDWRWSSFPASIASTRTVITVDTGSYVALLPSFQLRSYLHGSDALVPPEKIRRFSHDEFASAWINGDVPPIRMPQTLWDWERAKKVERYGRRSDDPAAKARAASAATRRDAKWDVCEFEGDRGSLITATQTPATTGPYATLYQAPTRIVDEYGITCWSPRPGTGRHGCAGPVCRVPACWGGP